MPEGDTGLELRPNEVVVRFKLVRAEYLRTWYRWYARRYGRFLALMLVLGTVAALDGIFIASALVALWLVVCVGLPPLVLWRRNAQIRNEQEHSFSERGTRQRLTNVRGECDWDYWTELAEVGSVYVLGSANRGASFIPRRAFASESDERRFRILAEAGTHSHL